jgi:hypothetical protein
MVVVKVVG